MTGTKKDLIEYHLARAKETLEDARLLAEKQRWNSATNRLYYAAYYAVTALLPNGCCQNTTRHFHSSDRLLKDCGFGNLDNFVEIIKTDN
jgi:uncharacterized protein (UPF0332 family)